MVSGEKKNGNLLRISQFFNITWVNLPPVTIHVNFISPVSSYGEVRDDTTSPFSSIMEIFWGGTKTKKLCKSRIYDRVKIFK